MRPTPWAIATANCVGVVNRYAKRLEKQYSPHQVVFALAVVASRQLRQMHHGNGCTEAFVARICKQFARNANQEDHTEWDLSQVRHG